MKKATDYRVIGIFEDSEYRIEIGEKTESFGKVYEAWLWRENIGTKSFMFGLMADQIELDEFIELVDFHLYEGNCYTPTYEDDIAKIEAARSDVMLIEPELNELADEIGWLYVHNKNYTKAQYNKICDCNDLIQTLIKKY